MAEDTVTAIYAVMTSADLQTVWALCLLIYYGVKSTTGSLIELLLVSSCRCTDCGVSLSQTQGSHVAAASVCRLDNFNVMSELYVSMSRVLVSLLMHCFARFFPGPGPLMCF